MMTGMSLTGLHHALLLALPFSLLLRRGLELVPLSGWVGLAVTS